MSALAEFYSLLSTFVRNNRGGMIFMSQLLHLFSQFATRDGEKKALLYLNKDHSAKTGEGFT